MKSIAEVGVCMPVFKGYERNGATAGRGFPVPADDIELGSVIPIARCGVGKERQNADVPVVTGENFLERRVLIEERTDSQGEANECLGVVTGVELMNRDF
ncbi:hypothetical protein ASD15_23285 [Massilia sp. Root351]|nr:hypothetical protein ASD15_23285 [Massilia sp. Root351]